MAELDFHFQQEGDPAALPVVFLHAFPYHSGMWDEQRLAVSDRAHFIALDLGGLGPSPSRRGAYMLEHLVDDLIALLDHLSIPSAVLCGLSMGGYVALRAVERYPARVRGLLLADTQAASDSDAAKLARADGVRSLLRDGIGPFTEAQLKRGLSPYTHAQRPALLVRMRALCLQSEARAMASGLVALATRTDTTDTLARIAVPTSIVVGEHDVITPPATARALAERIPGADLHVLENAGHIANVEAPQAFNRVMLALLARVEAAEAAPR
jgi:3-oxoadipate enol-lactonase